jgi:hypothetical protein
LIRERRCEPAMRRKIGRSDRHGFEQQSDRGRAIAGLRESRGPFAQRGEGGANVLLRRLRARETAVRLDVAVLFDELPVRSFRVLSAAAGEKPCGCIAREAVTAVARLLRDAARCESRGELGRAFIAHRARGLHAHALDQATELRGTDRVGVHAEGLEFRGEECLRGRAEVALGHTQQLLRKRVQSSPEVASSDNA